MKKSLLQRLARFLRPYGARLVLLVILMVASNLLALTAPMLSGWAVDAVGTEAGSVDFAGVLRNAGGMLACYACSSALNYIIASQLIKVGQGVSHDLRKAAFDRMSELPVEYFDTHPAGDLISRICYDVDTVNATISSDFLQLSTSVLSLEPAAVKMRFTATRHTVRRKMSLFREKNRFSGSEAKRCWR